jgi:predicted transposase YbfD/YdcC
MNAFLLPSASTTEPHPPLALMEFFVEVPDPRRRQKSCDFRFSDLIFLAVTAVMCGCDDWEEVADFGEAELIWYQQHGVLLSGPPSHDTLRRVFMLLDKKKFAAGLAAWVKTVCGQLFGVVAIDGKTVRGSRSGHKPGVHIVSAWSAQLKMTLVHQETAEKSNEITAIPQLLQLLSLQGCLITIDAMGCQREIAKTICEQGGDYLLTVKENQPTLAQGIAEFFTDAESNHWKDALQHTEHTTEKTDHGRHEIRVCHACHIPKQWLKSDWLNSAQIVRITRTRTITATGITTTEQHYAITSDANADAQKLLSATRQHWGIENKNHYVLDVIFKEDHCRIRSKNGAENFATIRRFALNILNLNKEKISIKRMRRHAYYYPDKRELWLNNATKCITG